MSYVRLFGVEGGLCLSASVPQTVAYNGPVGHKLIQQRHPSGWQGLIQFKLIVGRFQGCLQVVDDVNDID
jgi:hypothetical protein